MYFCRFWPCVIVLPLWDQHSYWSATSPTMQPATEWHHWRHFRFRCKSHAASSGAAKDSSTVVLPKTCEHTLVREISGVDPLRSRAWYCCSCISSGHSNNRTRPRVLSRACLSNIQFHSHFSLLVTCLIVTTLLVLKIHGSLVWHLVLVSSVLHACAN